MSCPPWLLELSCTQSDNASLKWLCALPALSF